MFKYFTILFSVLILSLCMFPCSDDLHLITSEKSVTQEHSTDSHDNCSPFCVCNCCKTISDFSIKKIDILGNLEIQDFGRKYPLFHENLYSNSPLDIWLPPKLS